MDLFISNESIPKDKLKGEKVTENFLLHFHDYSNEHKIMKHFKMCGFIHHKM